MSDAQSPTNVLVLGASLPELAAAYEFARYGIPVTILEHPEDIPDLPRLPQSDPQGVLARWITEVGSPLREGTEPACQPRHVAPGTQWIWREDASIRVPDGSVFGIPSSPLSVHTMQAVGTGTAFRAYLDRLKPVLTIGKAQYVDTLIVNRLGKRVLDVLVDPPVSHLFGRPSSQVEVAALAPGLNETQTRVGSLTGAALAYADRYDQLAGGTIPDIGWAAFAELLRQRLTVHGAEWVELAESAELQLTDETALAEVTASGAPVATAVSGSARFAGSVLITRLAPREHRVEITFEHDEAPHAPGVEWEPGTQVTRVFEHERGRWTMRSTCTETGGFVTELRSPVVAEPVAAIPEMIEAAGFTADEVTDLRVAVGTPLAATEDPDAELSSAPSRVIDAGVAISERGLGHTIERITEHAQILRRELLGLTQ